MFMGDTGSQFLGLFLAAMGIDNCWNIDVQAEINNQHIINFLLVGLVFLIPLTDTTTVVINRMRIGQSPFVGGKDHTTHHLFFRGVTEKRIAILYFLLSSIAISFAYNLIFSYRILLVYGSIAFVLFVFLTLYLNTVLRKK
jgi:UDP-GlcNAc:undecaprenyl-phosphate GlcNAc-1-phosphate transferase